MYMYIQYAVPSGAGGGRTGSGVRRDAALCIVCVRMSLSLSMYVCMYVCMYIYIYIYIHTYVRIHT